MDGWAEGKGKKSGGVTLKVLSFSQLCLYLCDVMGFATREMMGFENRWKIKIDIEIEDVEIKWL